jgi:hypothetical protein
VTLLQGIDRLLPELPERLGDATRRSLAERGVHVMLDAKAASVTERGVLLARGTMLAASTVVCPIGTMQKLLVERSPLLLERGCIIVNADLSIPAMTGSRHELYERMRNANPERRSGSTRNWLPVDLVVLNPPRRSATPGFRMTDATTTLTLTAGTLWNVCLAPLKGVSYG